MNFSRTRYAIVGVIVFAMFVLWPQGAIDGVGFACAVVAAVGLYLLPWIIAKHRKHHNQTAIGLVVFFFGWTVFGWICALIWANTNPPPTSA